MNKGYVLDLLEKYKKNPNDFELINKLAIWYSKNYQMYNIDDDYDEIYFFEKAYNTKKTIKTINNYASSLFYECYEHEKALSIQKECIDLKPKSFLPYLLYATILIELNKFEEAIKFLEISQDKHLISFEGRNWTIDYNLGYCNYMIWNYKTSEEYFISTSEDKENDRWSSALFWLALIYYKNWKKKEVYELLEYLRKIDCECDYYISCLYFLYDDYKNVRDSAVDFGLQIDFFDRKEIWYSIYKADKKLFLEEVNERIDNLICCIEEINSNHKDWEIYSSEERLEYLNDFQDELDQKRNYEHFFSTKPHSEVKLFPKYYWCSVFWCCSNPENDY